MKLKLDGIDKSAVDPATAAAVAAGTYLAAQPAMYYAGKARGRGMARRQRPEPQITPATHVAGWFGTGPYVVGKRRGYEQEVSHGQHLQSLAIQAHQQHSATQHVHPIDTLQKAAMSGAEAAVAAHIGTRLAVPAILQAGGHALGKQVGEASFHAGEPRKQTSRTEAFFSPIPFAMGVYTGRRVAYDRAAAAQSNVPRQDSHVSHPVAPSSAHYSHPNLAATHGAPHKHASLALQAVELNKEAGLPAILAGAGRAALSMGSKLVQKAAPLVKKVSESKLGRAVAREGGRRLVAGAGKAVRDNPTAPAASPA